MKKGAKFYLKSSFKLTILLFIFLSATGISLAQEVEGEDAVGQEVDSLKTGVALGKLKMENPDSIVSKYTYDPNLDRYIYTVSVGDFDINYPVILTPDQYMELVRREGMKSYFKEKIDAFSGKKDGSEAARKNLLPNFYVNNSFFESVFGGNTIEVIPQGSVAMDLGVIWQKNDNPSLSPRNRTNLSFDFDQRISLSMLGKIGERLQVTANYDTEATFDFQNLVKLDYTPSEDDILQKIEVGNVSMPLNSSLITGAQSLFGVKTELQFGKTRVTAVFSEQRSQSNTVVAQGGGTVNNFELRAQDYDADKHFFLAHYFRDNYDAALVNYPYIRSQVQITRLEVWITNRSQQTVNIRNVVAIQDLGEVQADKTRIGQNNGDPAGFFNSSAAGNLPRNAANDFDPLQIGSGGALTSSIRDIATVQAGFNVPGYTVNQGFDYAILENARKLEQGRDFTFNSQLGYISLNQRLSNDEVLGVAFQYTYNGEVYQVGEFANGGVDATTVTPGAEIPVNNNTLILKLLKSNITNVVDPIWDLMMKNIYATGAYQLSQEDFKLNILYAETTPRNYITPVESGVGSGWPTSPKPLEDRILLDVFNLDRLNAYNDLQNGGDGFFDYVEGITINSQTGSIIFTKVEPFGEYLFDLLGGGTYDVADDQGYNANQQKYVFRNMYSLPTAAAQQDADKNRFILKGTYKSQGANGIPIGAFNVPQGSVRVTAGGRQLQEGIDYTVNYQAGTVQILDPSLEASNTPINISVENNAVFGQQTRRFTGVNVEHQFNKNFVLGGTLLNLNEKPLTQKSNYGIEPVNNTIFGLNSNFSTEVPFLTRLVNKLPNIDTDVPSNLSVRGEVAFLSPSSPKNADFNGETTTYLDDFEGAQSLIDIRSFLGWSMASPPAEFATTTNSVESGYGRAKMAWYTVDPIFYSNQRPTALNDDDISTNETRRIYIQDVFNQDVAQGQTLAQNTLDIAYYPDMKGPYNANPNFTSEQPQDKWAGIMRSLSSTNFEQSNVEYVQFWVLDPYVDGIATSAGDLVINLGNISEDILPDGRKQYENGLPVDPVSNDLTYKTNWGKVPATQSLIYAFDADVNNRGLQDIGFDGLTDAEEATYTFEGGVTYNGPAEDPALDNYEYFLNSEGSILERYLNYNNPDGNSPVQLSNSDRGSTTLPDVEDIDRDGTMNTVNSYYEYRINIKPGTTVNDKYVTDIKEGVTRSLPNGNTLNERWIQYKIPLSDFTDAIGGISDFRSISFMRMYLTGFSSNMVLRFATLDLVRGDWRTYAKSLQPDVDGDPTDDGTLVDVNAVNVEENANRTPIPYVLPPGVIRERLNNNNTIIRQNEQSLSFVVDNLEPQDSRGVFKNLDIDVRQYKRLKMFMHAEEIIASDYADDETPLVGFLRIGSDFTQNYYQIELPLKLTPHGASSDTEIWPDVNELDLSLDDLSKVKSAGIAAQTLSTINYYEIENGEVVQVNEFDPRTLGKLRIGIRGNPSLGGIRSMMVGVKNNDNLPARGEVWFNELRLSGLDNNGGWAAIAAMDMNMADFANMSATGSKSTSGFGAIDQMPNERAREDAIAYDVVTNVNIGQLFPKKWGLQLPFNYGISEQLITPEFDPVYDDLKLEDRIAAAETPEDAEAIRQQGEDYTKRTSINFIGVRKDRGDEAEANFYDIENFTFNYSYNEVNHRDFEIDELQDQNVVTGFVYNHNFKPAPVAPFAKKDSLFTGKYWKWLKDLNLNVLPASVSLQSNINRSFNQQKFRDVFEPGVEKLELPFLQQRNYLFNWQYAINYSLTKSLRLNLTASNNNIVRNYFSEEGNPDSEINQALGLWDGFFDFGEPNRHSQEMQLNYELPFNKIPAFDFINAQYTYTSNFDWQRGGDAMREVAEEDINTVQNASTHNLTASLTMQKFYDFLGLGRKDIKGAAAGPARLDKAGNPASDAGDNDGQKATGAGYNAFIDVLTMVKRVNVTYSQNSGKVLPGYTRSVGFIGTAKPTIGFVFGSQADVRYEAARNGWLTTFPEFNQQYIQNTNKQLNITATAQPTRDLTIDLVADRQMSESYQETFNVEDLGNNTFEYVNLLGNNYGNFSISTLMIGTVFNKSDEFSSDTFETFKENRITVANRIVAERNHDTGEVDDDGFPERYGKTSQDVLLPAFFAAYTGKDPNKVSLDAFRSIPIPNWNIKFTGLMRNPWFKKKFKRFSLSHGYRSAYSINSFQTNLTRTQLINEGMEPINTETQDFLPVNIMNNVVLTDQFNPLMRVDFEMQNSLSVVAEIRTDRALSLSFDNSLMTEINGKEYTVGLGYRFKDVKFVTNIGGEQQRLKGDLNLKADVTLRDNITIIRNLDIDNNQITSGQNLMSVKFVADYALSKNLNALFFYDHSFSKFAVSTAFPQTSINTGFTLRYNFGN
ncbi:MULTISPECIES: cell surface protein SprA [unclassified Arenibacter]|uniref:T9SS outer membrane translocon Sov/SprA n=1 Tax=unclassified Arenibacter TaxID=2615047 RepID=UPI000E346846|nr:MULTISPECIES: cell surface protein SprA [unclassified Arenibacter]MCM4162696.1 cell surface protein SprA [Arenibacter sp. A80]RFT58261.1 cell surface protein SprA [Arenibacter sp. P308M17]